MRQKKPKTCLSGLNRYRVQRLILLFIACYRQGVREAEELNDEGECNDSIRDTSEPGYFGYPSEHIRKSSDHMLNILYDIATEIRYRSFLKDYEYGMGVYGQNHMSVALPVCQDFINQGMRDYFDYAEGCDMYRFKTNRGFRLTRLGEKEFRRDDVIGMAIKFCHKRQARDELKRATEGKVRDTIKADHYDTFIRSFAFVRCHGYKD